jgi:hypothetical protein
MYWVKQKQEFQILLQFATILNECHGELFIVVPPIISQKFMAKEVGGFAKKIGYKGFIPFPKKY